MDDPTLRQPGNHLMSDAQLEELRLTTDIILQAAELVQELECGEPSEAARSYFINDSLDTDALYVPWSINALLDGHPEEVVVIFDTQTGALRESVNIKLAYAETIVTLSRDGMLPATEPFVVELASLDGNAYTITEVSPDEVSIMLATLLYPKNTPELSRYDDPNDRTIAEEIQDVLRQTAGDDHTGLMTYLARDGVTEIIGMDDGQKITDIEVVWTLQSDLYFSVELGMPVHDVKKVIAKMALDQTEKGIAFFIQKDASGKSEQFTPSRKDLEDLNGLLEANTPERPEEVKLNEEDI